MSRIPSTFGSKGVPIDPLQWRERLAADARMDQKLVASGQSRGTYQVFAPSQLTSIEVKPAMSVRYQSEAQRMALAAAQKKASAGTEAFRATFHRREATPRTRARTTVTGVAVVDKGAPRSGGPALDKKLATFAMLHARGMISDEQLAAARERAVASQPPMLSPRTTAQSVGWDQSRILVSPRGRFYHGKKMSAETRFRDESLGR